MAVDADLDAVTDGAVLAADVLDGRQNVLLAAGTRLTAAHIALLRRRGVRWVKIQALPEAPDAPAAKPEPARDRLAELLVRQDKVFAKVGDDPLMAALHRAARAHLQAGNLPPG